MAAIFLFISLCFMIVGIWLFGESRYPEAIAGAIFAIYNILVAIYYRERG